MNALISLEPRLTSDAILEPDVEFPSEYGNLHYSSDERPNFCPTSPVCTYTIVCVEATRYCP
jgi:hypothetical protein